MNRASSYNLHFAAPLDEKEVNGIAKSIAMWTCSTFSESLFHDFVIKTHRSDIQFKIGKLSKGGGRPSLGQPWDKLCVSRATYFRKLKNGGLDEY